MGVGSRVALAAVLGLVACACTTPEVVGPSNDRATVAPQPPRKKASCKELAKLATRVRRGYVDYASPDISLIPREPSYVGTSTMPVHSGPWPYLVDVPLVLYGPDHIAPAGEVTGRATMADLAATSAELIGFDAWPERDGRVLRGGLTKDPDALPRLVVSIVWDGAGDNVLARHPTSWPYLHRLMSKGASYVDMTVGSSPSVTPSVHATLGTGAWPSRHGIPGLAARVTGGELVDPLLYLDPSAIRVSTLADAYGRATHDRAVTGMLATSNWHLGMIGHGASLPGGDRDPVVLLDDDGAPFTNTDIYTLPAIGRPDLLGRFIHDLDVSDGRADDAWRGNSFATPLVAKSTPARVAYEGFLLRRLIVEEGFGRDSTPDLLYVNFKASDEAGHRWGMTSPEVSQVLKAQDAELKRLVKFLDDSVGPGRWALMLTADHGQTPYPGQSGGWAVAGGELARDINAVFDDDDNGIPLVPKVVSAGIYLDRREMRAKELEVDEIARWVVSYTAGDNLQARRMPSGWEGRERERLFDALLVEGEQMLTSRRGCASTSQAS